VKRDITALHRPHPSHDPDDKKESIMREFISKLFRKEANDACPICGFWSCQGPTCNGFVSMGR
jgi:hypothetical protein